MPWNVQRSAQFYDKEVLKFPAGLDAIKSIVLDATNFTYTPDTRNVVPAGTILAKSVTNPDKYVAYAGLSAAAPTGGIEGILGHSVDLIAQTTSASEPAPMFYFGCVFATLAIVGFTQFASALVSQMPTCRFE